MFAFGSGMAAFGFPASLRADSRKPSCCFDARAVDRVGGVHGAGRTRWPHTVVYSGSMLVLIRGFCITKNIGELMVLILVFVGVECVLSRRFDWRKNTLRALPMLASALLIVYYTFHFLASKTSIILVAHLGDRISGLHWYLLSLRLWRERFFVMRIALYRLLPPSSSVDRLLFR